WCAKHLCLLNPLLFFSPPFIGIDEQFAERAQNDAELRPGGTASLTWQVMHAKLFLGSSSMLQGVQQLRIDHGTTCLQRMLSEEVGVQEFKRAIYVSHVDTKHPADQQLPSPGVEFTHPGVLAIYAIANDRIVAIDEEEERSQVTDVKLPIGIHKKGELLGRRCKTTHEGRAIALIDGMDDETNPGVS